MKITELAQELEVSTESIKQFIEDFDLELSECLHPDLTVKPDFLKFARENQKFLRNYEKDLSKEKTSDQIAQEINQPVDKVEQVIKRKLPNLYENGMYRSSVSSYGIDHELGGNYRFVYDYFGRKTPLARRDFIGYRDLFFYITEMLNPFIDPQQAYDWGINKPAGIILYGPKGSGRIFWARKIAQIIGYQFKEVKQSYLGTSFVDGNKTNFNDYLSSMMKGNKVVLFLENFDQIAAESGVDSQYAHTKDMILHSIHHFVNENLLMIVSADQLEGMDSEVFAPGRMDVRIPVFPPNADERAQMILRYMTLNLEQDSALMEILKFNGADKKPFWQNYAAQMRLFSNTMVIDFTQSLKKRLRTQYLRHKSNQLRIDSTMLDYSLRQAATKLTDEYLSSVQQFIREVSASDYDVFARRIEALKKELDTYRVKEAPRRKIGFDHHKMPPTP